MTRTLGWMPTLVMSSTMGVGIALGAVGVLGHRTDLVVLVVPLLAWALVAQWSRPVSDVEVSAGFDVPTGIENAETRYNLDLQLPPVDQVDAVSADVAPVARISAEPAAGTLQHVPAAEHVRMGFHLRPLVWGTYPVGRGELRVTSAWGGYVARGRVDPRGELVVLPSPRPLRGVPDALRASHLIGSHTSRLPGEGTEFAEIREFRPGDRIRRVHWATSARRGSLHVRTQQADRDAVVVLVLDATSDIPAESTSQPSSVESAVQAAAQVAGHVTSHGDRVALRVVGGRVRPVPAGSGAAHLRRILRSLATVEVAAERDAEPGSLRLPLPPGSTVVALTALTVPAVVDAVAGAARRGHPAAVIDVCPDSTPSIDQAERLGWRLLDVERGTTARRLVAYGVPVIGWTQDSGVADLLRLMDRRRVAMR